MTRNQRPSDHLPTLAWQLRTSLEGLRDDADGPDVRDFRRFLRRAVTLGWRAAATGKFTTVSEVIELVREARPMVDDALPNLPPRALAAVEVQQALAVLYVGEDALREVELENRLADRGRHPTERAVLEVLAVGERSLRQAEVHARLKLPKEAKPTPSRVGQILRELYDHGFTRRQLARARGHAEAAHYQLAPRGLVLCKQLGVQAAEENATAGADRRTNVVQGFRKWPSASIAALGQAWKGSKNFRGIVSGLFQSAQNPSVSRLCLEELSGGAPTPEADQRKGGGPVIEEEEFIEERGRMEITREILADVQLVEG